MSVVPGGRRARPGHDPLPLAADQPGRGRDHRLGSLARPSLAHTPRRPSHRGASLGSRGGLVRRGLTLAELGDLPAVTDLVTAGRALGLGRTKAYELARAGQFPCPVLRAGTTWLVPTAGLLTVLDLPLPGTGPGTAAALTKG
jgi:hypothetical protein